jgi:plasmid maintenance system antidote protein VapI
MQQYRMLSVTERFTRWIALSQLTQTEIARQLGRHKSFVTQLKNGSKRPTLDDAVKLEVLTGIPAVAWAVAPRAINRTRKRRQASKPLVVQEKTANVAG